MGALLYAAGLVGSAFATTPFSMQSLEVLVGFGIAGTGFGVILAVVGRATADEHRSMALGIATAAGSAGQVVGAPTAEALLAVMSWQMVFVVFAGVILASLAILPLMRAPSANRAELEETLGSVLNRAARDPSYGMIFAGFFSCGYQLGFITAHFPALVTEMCGPIMPGGILHSMGISTTSALGAVAISVIGLANIAGTLTAGWAGKRFTKKYLLAGIYTGRTILAAGFILTPITPATVLVFSAGMGALWLATVPLTSGLVAHLYGLRYMGTLYGVVFFSHQLGSFLGVWLGGTLYDATGDYTLVWWIGIAVGAFSAIIHLPIREERRELPAAAA
jgi:predicted MFS family arabinose efflux permease